MKVTPSRANARKNNNTPFMTRIGHRLIPARLRARIALFLAAVFLVAGVVYVTSSAQDDERAAQSPLVVSEVSMYDEYDKYAAEAIKDQLSGTDEAVPQGSNDLITGTTYAFSAQNGIALEDMSSGTTTLALPLSDDTASPLQNIGFDFWYDGVRFTQFGSNGNGFIRLGATTGSSFTNSIGSTTDAPKIAAYWDDLCVGGGTGTVHYKTIGTAPNRKMIVEWRDMKITRNGTCTAAVGNGTFQMWLFESASATTPGVIQYVYGALPASAAADNGYSVGLQSGVATNFASVSTLAETVSYTVANNAQLDAIPAGKSYLFTPNVPAAPTGMGVSPITPVSLQLNWGDNATNEVGYAIYKSTDNVTFNFLTQVAADSTSFTDSGLNPSTQYFYLINAVTEGALSPNLALSATTTAAGNITSAASGNWDAPATWTGGVVPTAGDHVAIASGHTVTINSSVALSVTVQSGGILEFEEVTARTLTVGQSVTIDDGGQFRSNPNGTQTGHVLSIGRDLTNNGILFFNTNGGLAGAGIVFTGAANNTFGGTGAVTDIRTITINKGTSNANILELNTTNFVVQGVNTDVAGFLTLTNGTFKVSGSFTIANRVFGVAAYAIGATSGFWLNNPNFTVSGQNASPTVAGSLRLTQGTYNVGTSTGNSMTPGANSAINIEGGTMNIAGRLQSTSASISYTQSGGDLNVCTVGQTATTACFGLTAATNIFNMTGGNITLVTPSGAATPLDYSVSTTATFTANPAGTMLNVGTGAAAQTFRVTGATPNILIPVNKSMAAGSGAAGGAIFSRGATVTNNGAIILQGTSSRFDFAAAGPMSYGGAGTFGTLAAPFGGVGVSANSTFLTTLNSPIICNRVNLFQGGFINSNQITLGNAGASTTVVQIGSTGLTTPGGNFDVSPVHNQGTGGQIMLYAFETAPRTTGVEINPTRMLTSINLIDNINTVTIAGGDLTLTAPGAAIVLTNGRFITGMNNLILSSGTATVTRTNGFVDGNFRKTFAAAANKSFEVGTANGFSPVAVNVTAGTFPATFTVKAVEGPQPNLPTPSKALSRYWTLTEGGDVTADLTFNYLDPTDIPVTAIEANFVIQKFDGAFTQPGGTVTPATNQATIVGVTSFSDWTLAEPGALVAPGALQFSSPTYTVGEEGAQASITVSRTGGADGIVMVDYATVAGGSATGGAACGAGIDYVNTSGTLTFPDMNTSQSFNIPLCGDLVDEPDETVNLALSNPQGGATLGTQTTAVLTLTDDDLPAFVGPVTVTATAGTPGPTDYPTLKDAFDAINLGTHQGAINVFVVTDTTETASAVLNSGAIAPAAYTSVLVQPFGGARTITGSFLGGVIKLNGADNVTIDGRIGGVGRNLTIKNNSVAAGSGGIWLASVAAGNGASGNTIRNLEIAAGTDSSAAGTAATVGIIMCGTTFSATSNGVDNDNNSFIANRIIKARYGLLTRGTTTDLNINPIVTDNIIGSDAFGSDQIGKVGIFMQADTGAIVSRNIVQNIGCLDAQACTGADRMGIAIGNESWSMAPGTITSNTYTVTKNVVHDIIEELTFSAMGINLATTGGGSATNNLVANNFIYNVRANGTLGDQSVGLGIAGGHTDTVVFNSIAMTGDVDPGASGASSNFGSGIRIANANGTTHANLTLKNNSVYMDLSSSSGPTVRYYAISGNTAAYVFGTGGENQNNYYINPANVQLQTGGLGTVSGVALTNQFATLANWQAAYTAPQDAQSIQANPLHFSPTLDLHIPTNSPNVEAAVTIAGVADDIDNQARPNGTNPDIGADEAYASPGTLQFSSANFSVTETGGTATITITRAGGANGAVSVDYATVAGGTATGGAACTLGVDYINASGTAMWADLDGAPKTFNVTICADGVFEALETVNMALTNATGATLGTPNTAVLSISDAGSNFSGPVNVGTGETATSLTNPGGLFDAINNGVVSGNVTINITSDLTGETGVIALNEFASPFTMLIRPVGGARIITGSSSVGVIRLNSADRVTIDGQSAAPVVGGNPAIRQLTVNNINPSATAGAVIVVMSGANGAQNNTFKNINIAGFSPTATLIGIALGGATPGAAGLDNDNNRVENCSFKRAFIGIYNVGASAANPNTGTVITQNDLSATGADRLRRAGMLVFNENGIQITENSIGGITSDEGLDAYGIGVGIQDVTATAVTSGGVSNALISGNKINGIVSTNTVGFSASGIAIAGDPAGPNTISNNMISGVSAPSTSPDITDGIFVAGVTNSTTRLYHNSISMTGDRGAVASQIGSYGVAISGTTIPIVELKNNIFYTTQTSGGGVNAKSYSIGTASATFANLNSNFNDFFASGANAGFFRTGSLGATGTDLANLAAWQAATSQDAGSFAVDPLYVDPLTDLHLQVTSTMINAGTTGTGVTIDIDGQTRDATPDIGADEIVAAGTPGVLQFSAPTYTIGEAGVMATITVTRTGGSTGTVGVSYATVAGGTATGGAACGGTVDYVNTSGTLSFPDMNTSQTFNVPICSDLFDEADETVNLQLSLPTGGATLGTQTTAVLTITDDDATPSISIASPSPQAAPETNAGSHPVTFTVNLSAASGQTVTVHYQTNDGSATTANNDYVGIPDTVLTFNPGETSLPINVTVNGDTTPEPDESFTVDLSTPVNATIGTAQASATILNDDFAGAFSIDDVRTQEGNSGTHNVTFTVTFNSPSAPPPVTSVQYSTGGGTATAGTDYQTASGTLNFGMTDGDGTTITRTFTVTINGDLDKEPNETFFVQLSNPVGATISDGTGSCIITDEDRATVADFDRDLKTDLSVFRPSDAFWYIRQSTNGVTRFDQFGAGTDKIVPGDYDADGVTDLATFRPATGTWFIRRSSDFGVVQINWGLSNDLPVQGDYDGDDKTDVAVFRPSTGTWYVLRSSDSSVQAVQWGTAGDKVIPGDFDGDGKHDFSVFRPSAGTWFVQPNTDVPSTSINFGTTGDVPVSGDFDGDGSTDIAVFRPSDGNWYIVNSLTGSTLGLHWGQNGDIPVVGDYDADGISDIAVWRPSDGNWYILSSNDPAPPADAPIPVFGHWGQAGDKPVPAAYVPEQ